MRRLTNKAKNAPSVTPASADPAQEDSESPRERSFQLAPLAASPNLGGRPAGFTNAAKADVVKRKTVATNLITRKVKEACDATDLHKLPDTKRSGPILPVAAMEPTLLGFVV